MFCWRVSGPCGALPHGDTYLLPTMFSVLSHGTVKHPYQVWIVDSSRTDCAARTCDTGKIRLTTFHYPLPVLLLMALVGLRLLIPAKVHWSVPCCWLWSTSYPFASFSPIHHQHSTAAQAMHKSRLASASFVCGLLLLRVYFQNQRIVRCCNPHHLDLANGCYTLRFAPTYVY